MRQQLGVNEMHEAGGIGERVKVIFRDGERSSEVAGFPQSYERLVQFREGPVRHVAEFRRRPPSGTASCWTTLGLTGARLHLAAERQESIGHDYWILEHEKVARLNFPIRPSSLDRLGRR